MSEYGFLPYSLHNLNKASILPIPFDVVEQGELYFHDIMDNKGISHIYENCKKEEREGEHLTSDLEIAEYRYRRDGKMGTSKATYYNQSR